MKSRAPSVRDVSRWISQGYGQGELSGYRPFFHVRDIASQSLSAMVHCPHTNRVHHYCHALHHEVHMLCMFAPGTYDIRESFAALPWWETRAIAETLGIEHPRYGKSRVPWVLTTTILLSRRRDEGIEQVALSLVASDQSSSERPSAEWRQASILTTYWSSRGIRHLIITADQLPRTRARNLIHFWGSAINTDEDESLPPMDDFVAKALVHFKPRTPQSEGLTELSRDLGISKKGADIQLGRAIWSRALQVDLEREIRPELPLLIVH